MKSGSFETGDKAHPIAEPNAVISRNSAMINDFIDSGALEYAYSSPVMDAKISENAISTYAGTCQATWTLLGPPLASGWS